MRSIRWTATALATGAALGAGAAFFDSVPLLLGEVGEARVDRSGWSQAAEFASLILDSGWAWAATAVAVGWWVSRGVRPTVGVLVGALFGCVALVAATVAFYGVPTLFAFQQGFGWAQVRYWWAASVVLGSPLGAVGAVIRRPGPAGVVAALVVPAGAALNMVVRPLPAESPVAGAVMLTVCGAAAAATVVVGARAVHAGRRRGRDSGAVAVGALDGNVGGVVGGS